MGRVKITEGKTDFLEWACATEALPGEVECGDHGVVEDFDGGVMMGVIDGIGHGKQASEAATAAAEIIKLRPRDSVIALVRLVHERLRSTRGVVLALAALNYRDSTLTWIGVGNVVGSLYSEGHTGRPGIESVMMRGGMVGVQLPPLRAEVLPLRRGNLLVFTTDGVYGIVSLDMDLHSPPRELCERIMRTYSKGTDDALVLVARYLGGSDEEAAE